VRGTLARLTVVSPYAILDMVFSAAHQEKNGLPPSFRHAFLSVVFRGYYGYTGVLNRLLPDTQVEGLPFKVLPSVCKPLGNEHTIVDYLPEGKNVLEIGCGSGIITLYAARKSSQVTAVDISPAAVENTKMNLAAHGIANVIVHLSDGFQRVQGSFDVVLSNPPWENFELADPDRQWASSTKLIPALFRESGRYLSDDGLLLITCPAGAREKLVGLGRENGFRLVDTHPREKRKDWRVRLLTLLYLQIGFDPLVYVFVRENSVGLTLD
jgi:release factor glutamine methyltransferase